MYTLLSDLKYRLQSSQIVSGLPLAQMNVRRVIAVHFPKAGGSSLSQQFAVLLKSQLALDYAADPLVAPRSLRRFPSGKAMVFGHFHPDRYDDPDAFRLTFLRNPVETLISTYYFWKSRPDRGHRIHYRFLRDRPTLIDFARYEPINFLMSQTYFGGYNMDRFDFIGFDETRARDLQTLSQLLGIAISANVHINKTEHHSDEYAAAQTDSKVRAGLTDILAADIAFYERLRNRAVR